VAGEKDQGGGGGRRGGEEEPEERTDGWMATYSDMVTLLMTFFVLMFALSNADTAKFALFAAAMSSNGGLTAEQWGSIMDMYGPNPVSPVMPGHTLPPRDTGASDSTGGATGPSTGGPTDGPSSGGPDDSTGPSSGGPDDGPDTGGPDDSASPGADGPSVELQDLYAAIVGFIDEQDLGDSVEVDYEGEFLLLTLKNDIWFDSGSAVVKPEMLTNAKVLGGLLAETQSDENPFEIIVAGHTDNVPQNPSGLYKTNWQLSMGRAVNFLEILINESGLDPTYFRGTGCGEMRPIAPNDTPEGRQRNRRVEVQITVLRADSADMPYGN
jgi:chemotaxis protein MotB